MRSAQGALPAAYPWSQIQANIAGTSFAIPSVAVSLVSNLWFNVSSSFPQNPQVVGLYTNRLASLAEHANRIQRKLAVFQDLSGQVNSCYVGNWNSGGDAEFVQQYYSLRNRLIGSGIVLDHEWLRITEEWLTYDSEIAVRLLAMQAKRFVAEKEAKLTKELSLTKKASAILLKALRRSYQVGNLISSQRRWYLHHGSHPSGQHPLQRQAVLEGVFPA